MSNTKSTEKNEAGTPKPLGIFPTDISDYKPTQHKEARWEAGGMAHTILAALRKHGVTRSERPNVVKDVQAKFPKASDATLRTQIYRGIVHLRGLGEVTKEEAKSKTEVKKAAPKPAATTTTTNPKVA